jgi:phenylpropionate dioxygenase-like ring-hydroxylating dioxygenase large terminal subunit
MTATDPGLRRSPGISYQELLDTDTHSVPEVLRLESPRYLGSADIDIDRFIKREWHEREKERLWSRVWQFACREEHIPNPGDYIVYEITNKSYIVIRTSNGQIKSYVNACLHRGRQLKQYDGNCSELRCPFHGFAWTNEGNLKDIPAGWDFEHVNPNEFGLPEVKVGTWAGFVFINPDPRAESLESFLGGVVDQFERWDLGNRYVQAHVGKKLRCNWKIAQEAFSEAYHVNATHPQIMHYLGDTNSQVDIWDTYSRVITPGGTPSPLLKYSVNEADIMRSMMDIRVDQELPVQIPEGKTAREMGAAGARERWRPIVGDMVDQWSDAEYLDAIDYTVFPNFHPWGAFNRIVYRFRPLGDNHRESLMECFFLSPFAGERPAPAEFQLLDFDQPWSSAEILQTLGKVFDQDVFNMERVQMGLETTVKPGVTLANYQESKVRWFHVLLDEYLGA